MLHEILPPADYTLGPLSETGSAIATDSWDDGKTEHTWVGRVMPCINNQLTVPGDRRASLRALGDHPYGAIGKVFML